MVQKPWCIVLWKTTVPGGTRVSIFPDAASADAWVIRRRAAGRGSFTVTGIVNGDPGTYPGDLTPFGIPPDTVYAAEDLQCQPTYFPS